MKKNVLIVVDNLVMGGVTKVLENLLNNIDYDKFNIDLLVLHYFEDMKLNIPKEVNIIKGTKFFSIVDINIASIKKSKSVLKLCHKIIFGTMIKTNFIKYIIKSNRRKILHKEYDTEIGFCDGFSYIYIAYGKTKNKIAWMHTDIEITDNSKRYYKTIRKALLQINTQVGVSKKVCEAYKEKYDIKNYKVIHNIIDDNNIIEKSKEETISIFDKDFFNFITVGRLDYSKNHEMLLEVHKRLIEEGYKIRTYVIGDGQEKENIEQKISKYKLEDSFILLGRKNNTYPYVKMADAFVLSSRYEGLPTVLYEAIILGVPCISTNVSGAEEIIENKYGMITDNNEEALYNGLKKILDNKELLEQYKENTKDYKSENKDIIKAIEKIL